MKNYRRPYPIRGAKTIKIRGRKWRLILDRPPENGCQGVCYEELRTIYVRPNCFDVWSTTIHEALHAAVPDLSEEAVAEAEASISRALLAVNDIAIKSMKI